MKKINLIFVITIILVLFSGCGNSTKKNIKKNLQNIEKRSKKAMSDKEIELAIEEYYYEIEEIQQRYKQISIWYKTLGVRLLDQKEYGPALDCFSKALEITPDNAALYFYIGECASYLGNASLDVKAIGDLTKRRNYYQLAEDSYLKALAIEPDYSYALLGIGILYSYQMQAYKESIPYLEKLVNLEPENIDAMFILAASYYGIDQYDVALSYYDKIIDISKDESVKKIAEENKINVLKKAYE